LNYHRQVDYIYVFIIIVIIMISCIKIASGTENSMDVITNFKRITFSESLSESDPTIFGNFIVYSSRNITLYDSIKNTTLEIPETQACYYPTIYMGIISWQTADFEYYYIENGSKVQVFTERTHYATPSIFEEQIVFSGNICGERDIGIYHYNISTQNIIKISCDNTSKMNPDIWGDHVVWVDYRHGTGNQGDGDIYLYEHAQ
jgi:hypothetical protein